MSSEQDIKLNEKQKQVINLLKNSNDDLIISLLLELKEQKEFYYLSTLLELLTSSQSDLLKKVIVEFISDIKLQTAAPILAEYVSKHFPQKDVSTLVTACWQSRLDFSHFLDPFFDVLIMGEYFIAFEAFTVIENSIDSLSEEQLMGYMARVKKGVSKANRDKQLLLLEMISVLDKTRRAAQ